jgi:hypothetical protein
VDKSTINYASVVVNFKGKCAAQMIVTHGIRVTGKSHESEKMYATALKANAGSPINGVCNHLIFANYNEDY